jgi:predicted N-acyltransferase
MGVTCRVVDSIRELDEERWDALAKGELMMSHRWQRVMEASRTAYRPWYLLAEDHRGPLVAAVADASQTFGRSGLQELLLRRTSLLVGAPFSSRHCGLAVRDGATIDQLDRPLAELSWQVRRPLLGITNLGDDQLAAWRERGFTARPQPVSMMLDLDAPSYEAYLSTLTRKVRKELVRTRRRAAENGVTFRQGPLTGGEAVLYPLLAEVCARHGWMPFTPALFARLASETPGEAMVISGAIGGQSAGFLLCLRQGPLLLCILAGLRYALAHPASLYFLLFDELIRWSLQHGVRCVYAGLSNEKEKQRHGFRPRPRWLCVRAYPGPANTIIRLLSRQSIS